MGDKQVNPPPSQIFLEAQAPSNTHKDFENCIRVKCTDFIQSAPHSGHNSLQICNFIFTLFTCNNLLHLSPYALTPRLLGRAICLHSDVILAALFVCCSNVIASVVCGCPSRSAGYTPPVPGNIPSKARDQRPMTTPYSLCTQNEPSPGYLA